MAKKDLLDEIAARVKRKKELREEIAMRHQNIEAFVMTLIDDIEEMIATATNPSLLATLVPLYARSFEGRVKAIDPGSSVQVQWTSDANGVPRINGILVKFSSEYQTKHSCEEQLFVDVTSLLLR
ncbi:unnamed protein product [Sphagnum jensenii]